MARRTRTLRVEFEHLLNAFPGVAKDDADWSGLGYRRTSARMWRCHDGSHTLRLVWRNSDGTITTSIARTYTLRGFVLA